MALPKRRHSNARTRKRRAHDALTAPGYTHCSHCDSPISGHSVCNKCGYYKGQLIVTIKDKKSKNKTKK